MGTKRNNDSWQTIMSRPKGKYFEKSICYLQRLANNNNLIHIIPGIREIAHTLCQPQAHDEDIQNGSSNTASSKSNAEQTPVVSRNKRPREGVDEMANEDKYIVAV